MVEPDWDAWRPTQRAVLCFVRRGSKLLLIRKKLGLGAGKITAPGGRIEPGESAHDAAIRETREETAVVPEGVSRAGELLFQFRDGLALHCTVFIATGGAGDAVETEEAVPLWTEVLDIPYDEMWSDDALWMPWMLEGRPFKGFFCFDEDRMLSSRLEPA